MQPNTPGPVPGQPYNTQMPAPQPMTAAQLKSHRPLGLIIALVVTVLLLLGALGFGFWAFAERNDYKDNSDQKAAAFAEQEVEKSKAAQEAEFKEREKEPLRTYSGPSEFGSLSIKYPKTWAAYVEEDGKGSTPINGYLHPGYVPGTDSDTAFALRFEVLESPYDKVLSSFSSSVNRGAVKVTPIKAEKVPSVTGARVNGEIERDKVGSVVLFPLRDKTLRITVESDQFLKDFNNIILKNLTFTP